MQELVFSFQADRDCEITYFSGHGAGGQHRNKHQNCVRMKHVLSGVIATGQDERSAIQNKKAAFKRLINDPKFKAWLRLETARAMQTKEQRADIEHQVDLSMRKENLKVETF